MSVAAIQNAAVTAGSSIKENATNAANWLGRNVKLLTSNLATYASKAWTAFAGFLSNAKTFVMNHGSKTVEYLSRFYSTSKDYVILHKEAAVGIGIGAAITTLILGSAYYIMAQKASN